MSSEYAAASASLGTLNVLSFGLNSGVMASKPSPWLSRAGVLTGLAGVCLGATHLGRDRHSAGLGWANILVGTASAVASGTSLVRSSPSGVGSPGLRLTPLYGFDDRARPVAGLGATF